MKTIYTLIIAILMSSGLFAQTDYITAEVDGIGCPYCAYGLEKKLNDLGYVSDIQLDIVNGIVTFTAPTEKDMTSTYIAEVIASAGYTPKQIKLDRESEGVKTLVYDDKIEGYAPANALTDARAKFVVAGNCNACKDRIEFVLNDVHGVTFAKWKPKKGILKVKWDSELTDVDQIHQALAAAGHKTDKYEADHDAYHDLPECCSYRKGHKH